MVTQSKIYLNGNLCGTIASSNNWLSSVFVGAASHTSGATNNFNGTIDEVAIWNRFLARKKYRISIERLEDPALWPVFPAPMKS
jgi:hypothetical protein